MKHVRVGIIGFGVAGRVFHYPVIAAVPGLELVAVMERKAENRHLVPRGVRVVDSPDGIIDNPDIDLAVVAVPNEHHHSLARRCLLAGKHVVVEKPFTVTEAQAADLGALAREKGLVLSVHHNRRYDADFLTIRKLINEGRLGTIISYEAHFDRFRLSIKPGWKEVESPGAGMLYDLGSHLIDQALVLFGEPAQVSALIRRERPGAQVPDAFDIFLEFDGGPLAILRSTMLAREAGPRYIINGSQGSYVKRGIDIQEEHLRLGKMPGDDPDWGIEPEESWGALYTEHDGIPHRELVRSEDGDYRLFYEDVRDAISQRREALANPLAGQLVIRVIELAMRSSSEGRRLAFR